MAATREDIRAWLGQAKMRGVSHMVVMCDTYDHSDYPIYTNDPHKTAYEAGSMQRLMEVYSLALDIEGQLNERRAFHWE